jgi:glycosyltransferase involved in cell wall biosynthesis
VLLNEFDISVIIPAVRFDKYLVEAIQSVSVEDSLRTEIVVVLNNFEKSESAKLRNLIHNHEIPIVVLELPGSPSLGESIDFGIKNSRAPLIARLDSDDIAEPQRLKLQKEILDSDPDCSVVGSQLKFIDKDGKKLNRSSSYPRFIAQGSVFYNSPLAHPSVMFRRTQYFDAGGYSSIRGFCEDFDLWSRFIRLGHFRNLESALTQYRLHEHQASVAGRLGQLECRVRSFICNHSQMEYAEIPTDLLLIKSINHLPILAWSNLALTYIMEFPAPPHSKIIRTLYLLVGAIYSFVMFRIQVVRLKD